MASNPGYRSNEAHAARLVAALAVAALGLAAGCKPGDAGDDDEDTPSVAKVTCVQATPTTIDDDVEVTGVVATPPKADALVASPVAGRVAQVEVEAGDHVKAGSLLAVIEDPALPAGSLEAKAGVASARAEKSAADLEVSRQERLVKSGIGARKDLDNARARAAAAAAALEAANARAGFASKQLARRELRAPRAGVVLHVWKRVGESVDGSTSTPVAEIADISVLEIHAQVPPRELTPLKEGMAAHAHVLGIDAPIDGTVARVAPAVDPATMLGEVRIRLEGTPALKIGSSATVQIVTAQRPGLLVPATALRRSMVGADEVVVCADNVARVRDVTLGRRTDNGVEIAMGLSKGDRVVVDHVLGLQDGQQITAGSAAAPAGDDKKPAQAHP